MGGGAGGGGFSGTKGSSIIISDKEIHQAGKHFYKHGREMGYSSKKEYDAAAKAFARKYQNHPEASVYRGYQNQRGTKVSDPQRIISHNNTTVIINEKTGQVIDFYIGTEYRGVIRLERIR